MSHLLSARRDNGNFHQQILRGQTRFNGGTCRRVAFGCPGVPHFVHAGEVSLDVRQPDLRSEDAGFVQAGLGQEVVDLGQHLSGLALDVLGAVGGRLAAEKGEAVSLNDAAHALVGFDAFDFQHVNSLMFRDG